MDNFVFKSPTKFIFGEGTHKEAGKYVLECGAKKVLVLYGGQSAINSGLLDAVCISLQEAGVDFVSLGGVQPNPISSYVYKAIDAAKEEGIDFILAVGGGSVIDTAKAIGAGLCYDGDFLDFYKGKAVEACTPVATILTIAAAGSEGSPNTVITDESTMIKCGAGGECMRPIFSILDPTLTFTLPRYQSACGISDMVAHVCERYFTHTKNVDITDRFCEAILLTVKDNAIKVIIDCEDYNAQAEIMWAGTQAHNNMCGIGRVQDWASHDMSHQLSAIHGIAHGAALAVMFPAWMKYVVDEDVERVAQFASRVWDVPVSDDKKAMAMEGIARHEDFLKTIGMPTRLAHLDVSEEQIPELVEVLARTGRKTIGSFKKLTMEDVANIYKLAL